MNKKLTEDADTLIVEEIQSVLQEKRTDLKIIRSGIAVILAQISAAGYMAAAYRHDAFIRTMNWIDILGALGVILLGTATYLVVGPLIRIHRLSRKIVEFRQRRCKTANLCNESQLTAGDHDPENNGKNFDGKPGGGKPNRC